MILSRIARHMKQQHWTGVLIELVIVVVGVFLGLQAQNWNQARADRNAVHRFLGGTGKGLAPRRAWSAASGFVSDAAVRQPVRFQIAPHRRIIGDPAPGSSDARR